MKSNVYPKENAESDRAQNQGTYAQKEAGSEGTAYSAQNPRAVVCKSRV